MLFWVRLLFLGTQRRDRSIAASALRESSRIIPVFIKSQLGLLGFLRSPDFFLWFSKVFLSNVTAECIINFARSFLSSKIRCVCSHSSVTRCFSKIFLGVIFIITIIGFSENLVDGWYTRYFSGACTQDVLNGPTGFK